MKRILVVTNMYPAAGDVDWRGSFVKEQVEEFRRTYPASHVDVFHVQGRVSGKSNLQYLLRTPSLYRKLLFGGYDLIHCHHSFCVLMCFFALQRIAYTVHEGELNNSRVRSWIIRLAIRLSRTPIYVSIAEFKRSTHPRKQFLPCGINFETFRPDKQPARLALGIQTDATIIFFPADPSRPEKNAPILRHAEELANLRQRCWTVVYGGQVPRQEMPLWMTAADIVVSIGKFESDGLVIKEALACNTPVIATDVGNSRHYLTESSGLIVEPETQSLFDGIEVILHNHPAFSSGRERLQQLHQELTQVSNALQGIYETCSRG